MRYQNLKWHFEMNLPDGWRGPSFFSRILGGDSNPQICGPGKAKLRFAIGPISPEPSVSEMQHRLQLIANKYDHPILEIGTIEASGSEHATMLYQVPFDFPLGLRVAHQLKNYHIVFRGIEYVITSTIGIVPRMGLPSIAATNPVAFSQIRQEALHILGGPRAEIEKAEKLYEIHLGWQEYDEIVRTFRLSSA